MLSLKHVNLLKPTFKFAQGQEKDESCSTDVECINNMCRDGKCKVSPLEYKTNIQRAQECFCHILVGVNHTISGSWNYTSPAYTRYQSFFT